MNFFHGIMIILGIKFKPKYTNLWSFGLGLGQFHENVILKWPKHVTFEIEK